MTSTVSRLKQAHIVIGGTVLLFLVPALVDVLSRPERPYGYLAADAFYYFTIGVNWVDTGAPSFDQIHPTNGFHPLWQWCVTLLHGALTAVGASRFELVPVAVVSCLLTLAAAIALLGSTLTERGRISPVFALLPVGLWPLLISPFRWSSRDELPASRSTPLFGTLWNFANGLESALLLLTFAVVAWLYVKRPATTAGGALGFGVALGALSLARLDHAVFSLAIAGLPVMHRTLLRDRRGVQLGLWTVIGWLGVLGMYLVYNRAMVGRFMPVSGAVKSTFPEPTLDSVNWLLSLGTLDARKLMYALGRIGSITFPAVTALLYFPFALRLRAPGGKISLRLRAGRGRFSELMALTAIGVLVLAAYDTLLVVQWHIGEWYAPISVVFVSLFAVQVADRLEKRWRPAGSALFAYTLAAMLLGLQLSYFWELHRLLPWGKEYADFASSRLRECERTTATSGRGYCPETTGS